MFQMENTNDQSPRLRVVSEGQTIWLSNGQARDLAYEQIEAVAAYCETAYLLPEDIGDLLEIGKKHRLLGEAMATFGRFMGGE